MTAGALYDRWMQVSSATLRAAHEIALNAALVEVVVALHEQGTRPLVIKGPAVAGWLYDDPVERPFGDIDLLVDPERFDAAEATLAQLGFHDTGASLRAGERGPAHVWLRARPCSVFVDLHREIALIPGPAAKAWALLSEAPREVTVAGVRIETPGPAPHLVILALHAAQHGPNQPKPLDDLSRALMRVDPATWQAAGGLATVLGAAGAMREGLKLVASGTELADRLMLADNAARSVRLGARGVPDTLAGVEQVLATRGARARVGLIGRKLGPSPAFMRASQPLARRGLIGLGLAYLWRPLWLARKLPVSVRAWCTALPSRRSMRVLPFLAGGWWALRAWRSCRTQLRRGGLRAVSLPTPPPDRPGAQSGMQRVLAHVPASCLERSLIRQRWHAAHGRLRDVVIGIRGPASRFGAHAWLDGDPPDPGGFDELKRCPPSAAG